MVMRMWPSLTRRLVAVAWPLILASASEVHASSYDPLALAGPAGPSHFDLTAHDAARDRDIPLRIYLSTNTVPAPVILFSHGLGGSRTGSVFLG